MKFEYVKVDPYSLKTSTFYGLFGYRFCANQVFYEEAELFKLNNMSKERATEFVRLLNCAYNEGYNKHKIVSEIETEKNENQKSS